MTKFELEQRVEIHSLPDFSADAVHNGQIVTVVALPGYNPQLPLAYAVAFADGSVLPAIGKYLRPFPPKLPNGRGDTDKVTSWEEFDKVTGLESIGFRRPNHDY